MKTRRPAITTLCWTLLLLVPMQRSLAEPVVHYRTVEVDGLKIFYREAGDPRAPGLLLLHGFPSSSFMFRDLIPRLADRYHVLAPDYPGFGFSDMPGAAMRPYTFARIATLVGGFTKAVKLARYAIYVQDYGAPVGFRLALDAPERITAIIVQNGNAYAEGLSSDWDELKAYWAAPTPRARAKFREDFTPDSIREEYLAGIPAGLAQQMSPDTWTLDAARLARPGAVDLQLDLYADYGSNVALYPKVQGFLRTRHPPLLIVWGRYDTFFTVAGAKAYLRDVPDAQLHLLDAGHFALETHCARIAVLIREFLARHLR